MLQYGGDWYWGVDRLCHLESRLHREGVEGSLDLLTDPSPLLASAVPLPSENPLQIELFFSFRSPYSYVALPQLMALRDRHGIAVRVRPVLPMVMRGLEVPRSKRLYIALDTKREADRLGVPFGHVCDPLGKGIGYCMALFFRCIEGSGDELDRLSSIAKGIWAEARDVAHLPDLIRLADRAGISEADVRAAIEDRAWEEKARANRDALTALGLWGVPSLRIGGYATWGQDRIAALEGEIARVSAAV
jgi:2-hydroxychromene-2-carboxylate isomerase